MSVYAELLVVGYLGDLWMYRCDHGDCVLSVRYVYTRLFTAWVLHHALGSSTSLDGWSTFLVNRLSRSPLGWKALPSVLGLWLC